MHTIWDADAYDNFYGVGGKSLPNGKRKSFRSGYCETCNRNHSVDFVHDILRPVVGVAVLGLTLGALSGLLNKG